MIIFLSIIMMLSSLWLGAYYHRYIEKTWADMPCVLTCIGVFIAGFTIFINHI